MSRNGHHYTYHLRDDRTRVWATPQGPSPRTGDAYAVLSIGNVWNDDSRSAQLSVHIDSLAHARQLATAAVEILDHLRRADGQPITKTDEVAA